MFLFAIADKQNRIIQWSGCCPKC